jgi:hypothetical protein
MIKAGTLPKEKLPLTRAIVQAIRQDQPFDLCWRNFFRNEQTNSAARKS